MRCGACAHDFLLISALRQLAHDVQVIPVYTPVHTELGDVHPTTGVYLGGISAYLRVRRPSLGRLARWLRPVLDSSALLDLATRRMVSTEARELGEMTQTVLEGLAGPHAGEIHRLVARVRKLQADVVMMSNTLLSPLGSAIRAEVGIPVVAGFLGEDGYVMDLPEPYRTACIGLLRQQASDLSAIVCPSAAAAQQADLLLTARKEQLKVVFAPVDVDLFSRSQHLRPEIPMIGFLSVIRPAKGLDLLLRAVQLVADRFPRPFSLRIAGQVVQGKYAREARRLARRLPLHVGVEFIGEVELERKVEMLYECDVACFPSRIAETRALAAMEAMACGTPIIAPALGSFPELVRSGGGWLFEPGNVEAMARSILSVITSPDRGRPAGLAAQEYVRRNHEPVQVARDLEAVLREAKS